MTPHTHTRLPQAHIDGKQRGHPMEIVGVSRHVEHFG